MSKLYLQRGYNNLYPTTIEVWRLGENVPEWLSDNAKIKSIDDFGEITLEMNKTSTGGYEIISSIGKGTLVRTQKDEDYICIGVGELDPENIKTIFSLTPLQLKLLYVEKV